MLVRLDDSEANDSKANDSKANDREANDSKANDSKANDREANDSEANDRESNDREMNGMIEPAYPIVWRVIAANINHLSWCLSQTIFLLLPLIFLELMRKLKSILTIILFFLFAWGCGNSNDSGTKLPSDIVNNPSSASDKVNKGAASIEFEKTTHDFGKIIQGEKVTYAFKFENTGTSNLIISDVSSSCGCTVPSFTKDPVKPGETGLLKVTFESENRKGFQNKTVTVVSNTQPNTTILKIKAKIVEPKGWN
jgi:hypothetical protein